jgi:hypothetical protein
MVNSMNGHTPLKLVEPVNSHETLLSLAVGDEPLLVLAIRTMPRLADLRSAYSVNAVVEAARQTPQPLNIVGTSWRRLFEGQTTVGQFAWI